MRRLPIFFLVDVSESTADESLSTWCSNASHYEITDSFDVGRGRG